MEPEIHSVQNGHEDTTATSSQDEISFVEHADVEELEEDTVPLSFSEPESETSGTSTLSTDELYIATDEADGSLARAKRVLRKCIEHCREARKYAEDGDRIKADNEMVYVQNRLPDLFT